MLMNETRFILLMELLEIISLYFLTFDFFVFVFFISLVITIWHHVLLVCFYLHIITLLT